LGAPGQNNMMVGWQKLSLLDIVFLDVFWVVLKHAFPLSMGQWSSSQFLLRVASVERRRKQILWMFDDDDSDDNNKAGNENEKDDTVVPPSPLLRPPPYYDRKFRDRGFLLYNCLPYNDFPLFRLTEGRFAHSIVEITTTTKLIMRMTSMIHVTIMSFLYISFFFPLVMLTVHGR
jgi:hypothetical protein